MIIIVQLPQHSISLDPGLNVRTKKRSLSIIAFICKWFQLYVRAYLNYYFIYYFIKGQSNLNCDFAGRSRIAPSYSPNSLRGLQPSFQLLLIYYYLLMLLSPRWGLNIVILLLWGIRQTPQGTPSLFPAFANLENSPQSKRRQTEAPRLCCFFNFAKLLVFPTNATWLN